MTSLTSKMRKINATNFVGFLGGSWDPNDLIRWWFACFGPDDLRWFNHGVVFYLTSLPWLNHFTGVCVHLIAFAGVFMRKMLRRFHHTIFEVVPYFFCYGCPAKTNLPRYQTNKNLSRFWSTASLRSWCWTPWSATFCDHFAGMFFTIGSNRKVIVGTPGKLMWNSKNEFGSIKECPCFPKANRNGWWCMMM